MGLSIQNVKAACPSILISFFIFACLFIDLLTSTDAISFFSIFISISSFHLSFLFLFLCFFISLSISLSLLPDLFPFIDLFIDPCFCRLRVGDFPCLFFT